jgi:hypothetical protein
LTSRLLSGERVLWSGRPGQGIIFTPRDTFLIPFSMLWCGFAIFWTMTATRTGGISFFALWGTMFICVGLYLVVGRFVLDAFIRGGIRYAVTNRRILIARPWPFRNLTAVSLSQLADVQLTERRGGRGTIRFGQPASLSGRQGMSSWAPSLDPTPQFLAIEDASQVFDLIQRSKSA